LERLLDNKAMMLVIVSQIQIMTVQ
jgi:hypothetical protein